jgi:hypothetical protein
MCDRATNPKGAMATGARGGLACGARVFVWVDEPGVPRREGCAGIEVDVRSWPKADMGNDYVDGLGSAF